MPCNRPICEQHNRPAAAIPACVREARRMYGSPGAKIKFRGGSDSGGTVWLESDVRSRACRGRPKPCPPGAGRCLFRMRPAVGRYCRRRQPGMEPIVRQEAGFASCCPEFESVCLEILAQEAEMFRFISRARKVNAQKPREECPCPGQSAFFDEGAATVLARSERTGLLGNRRTESAGNRNAPDAGCPAGSR